MVRETESKNSRCVDVELDERNDVLERNNQSEDLKLENPSPRRAFLSSGLVAALSGLATACSGARSIVGAGSASTGSSSNAENAGGHVEPSAAEGGIDFEEASPGDVGDEPISDDDGYEDGGEEGTAAATEEEGGDNQGDNTEGEGEGENPEEVVEEVDECPTFFDTYGLSQTEISALNVGATANSFDVAIWGTHGGADGSKLSALLALAPKDGMSFNADDLIYIIEDDDANTVTPVLAMHKVSELNKGHDQVFDNLYIHDGNQDKLRVVIKTLENGAYVYKDTTKWPIDGSQFVGNPEGGAAVTSSRSLVESNAADNNYTDLMPHLVFGDAPDATSLVQFGNPSARTLKIAESTTSSWGSLQVRLKFGSTISVYYTKNADNTWTATEGVSSGTSAAGTYEIDVRTILNKPLATSSLSAGNAYSFDLLTAAGNRSLLAEHNMFVISVKDNASNEWYRYYYFLG